MAVHGNPNVKKSSGGGNKKGTSAERRATHNAVERARRESLNVRFLELAANLPATCTVRRPSKNLIVNKSLEFVRNALNNDAVLRLKLDEVLRQNQTTLQELNQMRVEQGLPPREDPFAIQDNQLQSFSQQYSDQSQPTNALTGAYGMSGLPQPLASAEFTKQVTEKSVMFDVNNAQWFGSEIEDDYASNNASTDDHSAAASDHSSPSLTNEEAVAAAAAVSGYQTNPLFHLQPTSHSNPFAVAASSNGDGNTTSPAYAHYLASTTHHGASMDFLPPITPTTASVFSNLLNNIAHSPQTPQGAPHNARTSPHNSSESFNGGAGSTHTYLQGNFFAMPA